MDKAAIRFPKVLPLFVFLVIIAAITPSKGYGPLFPPVDWTLIVTIATFALIQAKAIDCCNRRLQLFLDLLALGIVILYSCHLLILLPGIPYSHDLNHYISAAAATRSNFSEGNIFSQWTHLFWCGMPLSRFYSPIVLLSSALLLPFDPAQSVKIILVMVKFVTTYIVYFTTTVIFDDRETGFWASICYALSGYNLINMNVRGDLAELFALMFVPLSLYSLWQSTRKYNGKQRLRWQCLSAIFMGLTIVNHVPTGIILGVWMVFWIVWLTPDRVSFRKRFTSLIKMLWVPLLGVGLSFWFLLPAVLEREFVQMGVMSVRFRWWHSYTTHLVEMGHLFTRSFRWDSSPWMPLYVGNVILALAVLSLPSVFKERKSLRVALLLYLTTIACLIGASTIMKDVIQLLWQVDFPTLSLLRSVMDNVIIFPWRILQIYALSSSVLAGFIIAKMVGGFRAATDNALRFKGIAVSALIFSLMLYDVSSYVGYVGGYTYPYIDSDTVEATDWLEQRSEVFRVYFANYEGEQYFYLYASGITIPAITGPRPDLRPVTSTSFVDKALYELEHVRWFNRAGYLSIKYIVIERQDMLRWSRDVDRGKLSIVKEFPKTIILENKLFRPYVEANVNLEDIAAPQIPDISLFLIQVKSEEIHVNIEGNATGVYYITFKENYYPAWGATVDGEKVEIKKTRNGFIAVPVVPGSHKVVLRFGMTMNNVIGFGISLVSILIVFWILMPESLLANRLKMLLTKGKHS